MTALRRSLAPWAAWAILLLVAAWAYHRGLGGGFLFDDFVNLDALGATGRVDNAAVFWRYITSGNADPTGRPVAMLSFLLDARDWPADPAPFLRTNLLLHLLNGTLLFLLIRKLGTLVGDDQPRSAAVATLATGAWLLHPLFVSTTLYVVQREAMLPATFVFAGLLAYCSGRARFARSQGTDGMAQMVGGLALGTLLAFLSKANGVLLPLLAWVLDVTVLAGLASAPAPQERRRGALHVLLVVLPSLAVGLYLLHFATLWNLPLGTRPWTIGERALTEPRILLDYLQLLVVPRSVSTGLYNETYQASRDLLHPWTTLPSLALVLGLLALGLHLRRRAPVLAAGVLFFLAGHALESSVFPLELYFEHRNYLPAALLAWPLARALMGSKLSASAKMAVATALLLLLAVTTYQRTALWGNSARLAALWATSNPDSSRAQATAAQADVSAGRPQLAVARLAPVWQQRPDDLQIALNYINARCAAGGISKADADRLGETLSRSDIGTLLVRQWLERALTIAANGQCPGLDMPSFKRWLAAAQSNPRINTPVAKEKSFPPLLALVALQEGQPDLALAYLDRALKAFPLPETAAGQVALLASNGYYHQALRHLDTYEAVKATAPAPARGMAQVHQWVLDRQGYWPRELGILRHRLEAEIANERPIPGASNAH